MFVEGSSRRLLYMDGYKMWNAMFSSPGFLPEALHSIAGGNNFVVFILFVKMTKLYLNVITRSSLLISGFYY